MSITWPKFAISVCALSLISGCFDDRGGNKSPSSSATSLSKSTSGESPNAATDESTKVSLTVDQTILAAARVAAEKGRAEIELALKDAIRQRRPALVKQFRDLLAAEKKGTVVLFPALERLNSGQVGRLVSPVTVISIANAEKLLVRIGSDGPLAMLHGIDTSDVTTDSTYRLKSDLFFVGKTETYRTVLGANQTVRVLESLDEVKYMTVLLDGRTPDVAPSPKAFVPVVLTDADKERIAASRLKQAETLEKAGNLPAARDRLRKLIVEFPGTPAAADARKRLDTVEAVIKLREAK